MPTTTSAPLSRSRRIVSCRCCADSATGKWSLNFRTILTVPRQIVRLAVEYEDVYRLQDGRWWIVDTVSRVTSMLTEQVGEDGSVTVIALAEPPAA